MAKKSNVVSVLTLGGIVAVGIYFLTGRKLQKLELSFKAFQKNIQFKFPYLYLPIQADITNPNKTTVVLNEINVDVYLNGIKASTIVYTTPVTLKSSAVSTLSNFLIKTEVFSAIDQAISKAITIRLKGYIRAEKINYPIDQTIQIL